MQNPNLLSEFNDFKNFENYYIDLLASAGSNDKNFSVIINKNGFKQVV